MLVSCRQCRGSPIVAQDSSSSIKNLAIYFYCRLASLSLGPNQGEFYHTSIVRVMIKVRSVTTRIYKFIFAMESRMSCMASKARMSNEFACAS